MKRLAKLTGVISLAILSLRAGTDTPRRATDFPNHKQNGEIVVGARLLSQKEVKKAFFTDVSKKFMIVEVALDPDAGKTTKATREQFQLRQSGLADAVATSSPTEVSKAIQKEAQSARSVAAAPRRESGYRTGRPEIDGTDPYDPNSRQKGYYTRTMVDVTWGEDATGAGEVVRKTLEKELTKEELPLGRIRQPVHGYLYFAKPEKKGKRFQLEFETDAGKVALELKR